MNSHLIKRKKNLFNWLFWSPQYHSCFLHFLHQLVDGAVSDDIGHAMFDACGFEASAGSFYAEDAVFGREGYVGKVRFPIGSHRDSLYNLNAHLFFWAVILLGACDLACEAASAVLVVDEQSVLLFIHPILPPLWLFVSGTSGVLWEPPARLHHGSPSG